MILHIESQLAQEVVNYLAVRPYREVAELVPKMIALSPAPTEASLTAEHSENMREVLADLIRSDQLRHEDVQRIMADEVFSAWYKKTYP